MPEISSNIVSCPVCRQLYDASRFPVCPYCHGQGNFTPTVDPTLSGTLTGNQGGFTPTVDPLSGGAVSGNTGAFSKTTDPNQSGGSTGAFDKTVDPNQGGYSHWKVPGFNGGTGQNPHMSVTQVAGGGAPVGAPQPVVGWLVAVEGPCRGTDYRIHTGYNYIGREYGDICIRGDMTISAEKDASVTYVPQTNRFYIAHEQGKNPLLVNDAPVLGGGAELHNYDRITVGSTLLLFVGLCGEQFSWTEKKEKSNG